MLFFLEMNILIQQGCIKLTQRDSKTVITLQKISISNKCCSFELSIHQRILKKIYITVSTKIYIDNIQKCLQQNRILE